MRKAFPHSTSANLAARLSTQIDPDKLAKDTAKRAKAREAAKALVPSWRKEQTTAQRFEAVSRADDKRRRRKERNIRIHLQF